MKRLLAIGLVLCLSFAALNESAEARSSKGRSKKMWGFYVTGFGDPFPSALGLNFAVNLGNYFQTIAGAGMTFGSPVAYSFGGGLRWMLFPTNYTIFIGAYGGYVLTDGAVSYSSFLTGNRPNVLTGSGPMFSGGTGFLWNTKTGFHLVLGINWPFRSDIDGLPYIAVGLFF